MTLSRRIVIPLLLAALTVAALGGVSDNGFIALDDRDYITGNSMVQGGLSAQGVVTAFTSTRHASSWHPLTWLSHMIDVEFFGLRPGPHHAVSLALHAANVLLLFFLLRSLTGALWRSALVAALFAVHPLHVESVAWAAERKDVLSTFFLLCTALAYLRAARRNAVARSVAVPLLLVLALMSKAMVITLPFLLLLLDWWPLNRWSPTARRSGDGTRGVGGLFPPVRLWVEKIPLFLLCAASTTATYIVADSGGAVSSEFPATLRLSNACVAYVSYLGKTIWPQGLSPFYPFPVTGIPLATVAGAASLLAGISVFAWRSASRQPYLALGWLWYLGTLVPVIGLVQAGGHAMADRYTYFPLVGIFVAVIWGAAGILARRGRWVLPAGALALALLVALAAAARVQAALWRDGRTLFTHALRLDANNWVAWIGLGMTLMEQGRPEEAVAHFRRSLEINMNYFDSNHDLGVTLAALERPHEALPFLQKAVQIRKSDPVSNHVLGRTLLKLGRPGDALGFLLAAVALDPGNASPRADLGAVQGALGRLPQARATLEEAVRLFPADPEVRYNFAAFLLSQGRSMEALPHFEQLLRLNIRDAQLYRLGGMALASNGLRQEAAAHFRKSLEIEPGSSETHLRLGETLFKSGRLEDAADELLAAYSLDPSNTGIAPALEQLLGERSGEEAYARAVRRRSIPRVLPPLR